MIHVEVQGKVKTGVRLLREQRLNKLWRGIICCLVHPESPSDTPTNCDQLPPPLEPGKIFVHIVKGTGWSISTSNTKPVCSINIHNLKLARRKWIFLHNSTIKVVCIHEETICSCFGLVKYLLLQLFVVRRRWKPWKHWGDTPSDQILSYLQRTTVCEHFHSCFNIF